jgi:hypothetical protein
MFPLAPAREASVIQAPACETLARGARAREVAVRRAFRALRTALRGETGFPQADVENDFIRARRQQVAARLAATLRHRPASDGRLVLLDEVADPLGVRNERRLGLQTISVATIVGTLDPRSDFDRRFRPTSNRVRPRWERLALAQRRGEPIPPIQVYRVGGLHFVEDGHHRVSIAAATRQQTIDAYVTEIRTGHPPQRPAGRHTR